MKRMLFFILIFYSLKSFAQVEKVWDDHSPRLRYYILDSSVRLHVICGTPKQENKNWGIVYDTCNYRAFAFDKVSNKWVCIKNKDE